jgi:DNA-binding HxlR family transcriptional regulator
MASPAAPERIAQLIGSTSLHRALAALGDWWSVLLIREAFLGVRQFDGFQARLGIPRQTLTNRLRELVANELLYTKPYQARPVRHEYRLTRKGLELYPYALLLWRWQRRWSQASVNPLPERLVHLDCGQPTEPVFGCAHCRQPATIHDVEWREGSQAPAAAARAREGAARSKRHTVSRSVADAAQLAEHGAFIVSDRWTHLIIACGYLGLTTFDGFQRALGIAPNILAQRLRLLVDARLLRKLADAQDSRRFQYRLTERSRDLFPISMMLITWADRWMPSAGGPPMLRVHRGCGQRLLPVVMCSACGGELQPWAVRFEFATHGAAAALA